VGLRENPYIGEYLQEEIILAMIVDLPPETVSTDPDYCNVIPPLLPGIDVLASPVFALQTSELDVSRRGGQRIPDQVKNRVIEEGHCRLVDQPLADVLAHLGISPGEGGPGHEELPYPVTRSTTIDRYTKDSFQCKL